MAGTPFVLKDDELQPLREYAEAHPIRIDEMKKIVAGKLMAIGDRQGHGQRLEFGYRVVYSIEEHPKSDKSGTSWLRHASMSIAKKGRMPNPYALAMVGEQLGFPIKDNLPDPELCMVQLNPVDGQPEMMAELTPDEIQSIIYKRPVA